VAAKRYAAKQFTGVFPSQDRLSVKLSISEALKMGMKEMLRKAASGLLF
jgi:hypothetical protein